MRTVLSLTAAICFLCVTAVTASAGTRVVSNTWDCPDGSKGWCRITINENTGKVIRSEGRDCDGSTWEDVCDEGGVAVLTWSRTSTLYYTGASPLGLPY